MTDEKKKEKEMNSDILFFVSPLLESIPSSFPLSNKETAIPYE
jgi:hypothetical protein